MIKYCYITFIWLSLISLTVFSCGSSLLDIEEAVYKRPLGLEVEALDNRRFAVSFYAQNQEQAFNGYNLYISKASISDAQINVDVKPLNLSGHLPTFIYSSADFDLTQKKTHIIEFYGDEQVLFEADTAYYFRLCAVSFRGAQSLPSNEASALATD